jgi:SAM-dependent methyltransferase
MTAPHLARVQERFGAIAADYRAGQARRLNRRLWLRLARPQRTDVALDVATGTGAVAAMLAPEVAAVVGLDASRAMLAQAREELARIEGARSILLEGDVASMPFLDATFDLVTCSRALHHTADAAAVVHELARVTRPGGRLVVLDNVTYDEPSLAARHNELETVRDPSHARTLSPGELARTVEAAGYSVTTLLVDEVLRPVATWLEDAGTDERVAAALLEEVERSHRDGDRFATAHFSPSAEGWRLRYRVAWLAAVRGGA